MRTIGNLRFFQKVSVHAGACLQGIHQPVLQREDDEPVQTQGLYPGTQNAAAGQHVAQRPVFSRISQVNNRYSRLW